MIRCPLCDGEGWICEAHPYEPEGHDPECSGPGIPCPECNTTNPPRHPLGWVSLIYPKQKPE